MSLARLLLRRVVAIELAAGLLAMIVGNLTMPLEMAALELGRVAPEVLTGLLVLGVLAFVTSALLAASSWGLVREIWA